MRDMWTLWAFISFSLSRISANMSPFSFCSDMNPQQHVNIEQLMGMWYGIEIFKHNAEEHYVQMGYTCPILHLSEDKDYPLTTYDPLYKDYNYNYNYGERRPPNRPTNRPTYEYDRRRTTRDPFGGNYNRRYDSRIQHPRDFPDEMKRLRIWWEENGKATEYHLRYNASRPGFWISSGPQNGKHVDLREQRKTCDVFTGSLLEPQYSDFAGTVQIIKAVGNHMVLTFCHQLPERQLTSILLSRENKLGQPDIHSVHSLLNRKGLGTNAITKVCFNASDSLKISLGNLCLLTLHLLLFRF